jgi:hypothetical protein
MVEQDFVNEKKSAVREFEEQKVYLRDQVRKIFLAIGKPIKFLENLLSHFYVC